MVQTSCCGFGASAIRQGKLIFAVGEVTAVPLGKDMDATIPWDLIERAKEVFHGRDSEFEFPELPVELRSGESSRIIYRGHVQMAGYHVRVENGFQPADDATPECVSISLDEACDWVAASATAQLLKLRPPRQQCGFARLLNGEKVKPNTIWDKVRAGTTASVHAA